MKKMFKNGIILIICIFMVSTCAFAKWKLDNPNSIKVFIPQGDDKTALMTKAFNEWQSKTKNFLTFKFVKNEEDSQIHVVFVEKDLSGYCGSQEALGCALNDVYYGGRKHTTIYIVKRRPKGLLLSNTQVYAIMRHEIGHALGLEHTKNANCIMFEGTNLGIAIRQDIRDEDVKAVYTLYGVKF